MKWSKLSAFFTVGLIPILLFYNACSKFETSSPVGTNSGNQSQNSEFQISLSFRRIEAAGPDPFEVTAYLKKGNVPLSGESLTVNVPSGVASPLVDNKDGTYTFTVTPSEDGLYPVEVTYKDLKVSRKAIVVSEAGSNVGQALAVPGDFVNTEGYEDGVNITPDGRYLIVQTGPVHFGGIGLVGSICQNSAYSMYDILGCGTNPDSSWVFDTIGPYSAPHRPGFPTGAITANGKLTHLNITIPGVANGIALFPTVFYGFKLQADGTFAEPFKIAFNDIKSPTAGVGMHFKMIDQNRAQFVIAWNNYFNKLGDDKSDIYHGELTLGQDYVLGEVKYSGEMFSEITPNISPLNFSPQKGHTNPFMFSGNDGNVKSIWVDDEEDSRKISVYRLSSGTFPNGTWVETLLPSKINTGGPGTSDPSGVSMPFFTGQRLYLMRGAKIVYHEYLGSNDNDFGLNSSWGDEQLVISGSGNSRIGSIYAFGEPTIAQRDGKKYLYFTFVRVRSAGSVTGRYDSNFDAGFVEIP